MTRWLVDGCNVVGARPDGWWRDRPGACQRLVDQLEVFARNSGARVTVVFDGLPLPPGTGTSVEVVAAPSADDRMVELAALDPDPSSITAVTSDRQLAARLRAVGTEVAGAGSFRRRLDGDG
ncbi:MAG: NYN domain-containing protein [Actinobacteria bacterium]|nr:NYN domain-containing protein [Actinomycetota bacterium]